MFGFLNKPVGAQLIPASIPLTTPDRYHVLQSANKDAPEPSLTTALNEYVTSVKETEPMAFSLNNLISILQVIFGVGNTLIPIFVMHPETNKPVAVALTSEAALLGTLGAIGVKMPESPTPTV